MIYQAILKIKGKEIPLLYYSYRCHARHCDDPNLIRIIQLHIEACEKTGNREYLPVEGDLITLMFECSGDEQFFYDWLNEGVMYYGEIHFIYNESEVVDIFRFGDCFCVKIEESMSAVNSLMVMTVYLSPGIIKRNNLEAREKEWKVSEVSYIIETPTESNNDSVSHGLNKKSLSVIYVKPPFQLKKKFQKDPFYETEMRKQLQMQQDGINNMTIFEWLKNRENFKKHGRNPKSKKNQEDFRDGYRNAKIDEYLLLYEDMDIKTIEAMVDSELEGLAALHNPDQIAGGYADVVTQMGDKRINSSIGSQWGSIEKGRSLNIENELLKLIAGPPLITEEEQKKIKMNVNLVENLEIVK